MVPIIEVSESVLEGLDKLGVSYKNVDFSKAKVVSDNSYIALPSGAKVARNKTLHGKNWYEAHQGLAEKGASMQTLPEFAELLKYADEKDPRLFEEITWVRSPWRAEWIDAFFEQREDGLYVLTGNKSRAEKLEGNLNENRTPGISLDSWIANPTKQGFPKSDIPKGNLYFWKPVDGEVARFGAGSGRAGLISGRDPSGRYPDLGVRAVRHE